MQLIYSDGGRSKYFKAEGVGDCVTRAICNATGMDYKKVYNDLKELSKHERIGVRKRSKSSVRNGVYKHTWNKYLKSIGWKKISVMKIGTGVTMHLNENELPKGILIVQIARHLTCVKDGVLYDTFDCADKGKHAVYSYWIKDNGGDV